METLMASNLKMGKQLIDRLFFHYESLEEFHAGMWRRPDRDAFLSGVSSARQFMMDSGKFSEGMARVCDEWPNSCASNFTSPSTNPVAWLGQASVCLSIGVPESCTRSAWMDLPATTQHIANAYAKSHIEKWELKHIGQGDLFNV